MSITRQLRLEHQEILTAALAFLALVRQDPVGHSEELGRQLQELSQKILAHLDLEDGVFYPSALKDPNPEFAAMARQYWIAMANIRDLFSSYLGTWSAPHQIRMDPIGFQRETEVIFGFLERRIERENRDLYPMAESPVVGRPLS